MEIEVLFTLSVNDGEFNEQKVKDFIKDSMDSAGVSVSNLQVILLD